MVCLNHERYWLDVHRDWTVVELSWTLIVPLTPAGIGLVDWAACSSCSLLGCPQLARWRGRLFDLFLLLRWFSRMKFISAHLHLFVCTCMFAWCEVHESFYIIWVSISSSCRRSFLWSVFVFGDYVEWLWKVVESQWKVCGKFFWVVSDQFLKNVWSLVLARGVQSKS